MIWVDFVINKIKKNRERLYSLINLFKPKNPGSDK